MKLPPFEYACPASAAEAVALLAAHDGEAKLLAGGQSLVPMLNFRLVRPAMLIDVNHVAGLAELRVDDGTLHIGALVRTAELERNAAVVRGWPLLRAAAFNLFICS